MPSWSPPSAADQRHAIALRSAPRDLLSWLDPKAFEAIPEPDEDDWPRGGGQTFEKYVGSQPLKAGGRRDGSVRSKIYLQPLGNDNKSAAFPCLATLAAGVQAFFGLQCVVLPMISLTQLEARGHVRIRRRGAQMNASDINKNLKSLLPSDGFTLCAVTMADVWKGDMNYLFGLAFLQAHVGVFSFHRHQPHSPLCEFHHGHLERQPGDEVVLLRRGFATLTHELGHTFGLKHCIYFSCLMQGANSLEEAEGRITDLCPCCLRKLLWATNAESGDFVRARYERLLAFYDGRTGFERHRAFVRRRLGMPAAAPATDAPTDVPDADAPVCEPCEQPPSDIPEQLGAEAEQPTGSGRGS